MSEQKGKKGKKGKGQKPAPAEEPKPEEPKKEEPKKEEPKKEEPKKEAPKKEAPKKEPKKETPKKEAPKKEEPKPEPEPVIADAKDKNAKDDDEEEMPELENQPEGENKFNRNEKKCRKALMKVGMKQMSGITRITLKKRDGLIFVIDDPEVLNLDNSYAIFGELKLEDLNRQMQMEQAKKFAQAQPSVKPAETASKAAADDGVPLSEDGLTPDHIKMVMEHGGCSRNQAIKVLRECNDDTVQAVMKLNES